MLCPYCKREISENARFCSKCGHKISRCPTCGRVLTSRLKYCTEDGTKLPDELLVDLPEAELMHMGDHPDQPQRRPNAPEPGFCIQCGAPCTEGQLRCAECQAKQQQGNSHQNKKKRKNQPQSKKEAEHPCGAADCSAGAAACGRSSVCHKSGDRREFGRRLCTVYCGRGRRERRG